MPQELYPLIFIHNVNENLIYTSPQSGGGDYRLAKRNRLRHGNQILAKLEQTWKEFQNLKSDREAVFLSTRDGIYLEFRSSKGFDLVTKSLENLAQGIRLLNVREEVVDNKTVTIATVYIPAGKENYFISRLEAYLDPDNDNAKGNPKNKKLVNSIKDVKLAVLDSFWQDNPTLIPEENPEWCEVWLRAENEVNVVENFQSICAALEIKIEEGAISFPERFVVLVQVNKRQLTELIMATDYLAEIRRARETVRFFVDLSNYEQTEWLEDLKSRTIIDDNSNTSICILDTGINNGHQLISPVLTDADMHSYNPDWGVNDHEGHGTRMSGIAIYGDLSAALQQGSSIEIKHILESGKILPPTGNNDPKLYGYITQQVISLAEIQAPDRNRIICLAVTTHDFNRGRPSSWSGAIDSLTSGAEDDNKRLIILSAGNVLGGFGDYPYVNEVSSVHSPSQSWNALSVGAYTDLVNITDTNLDGYIPLAPVSGLSPFSTTSLTWEKKWPLKPEVLFEGGNVAIGEDGFVTECDDLSILTTHHQPSVAQFDSFCMTSAATAKASWMAAQIQSSYPDAWPETTRGLIIHSADWSQTMKDQFFKGKTVRDKYYNLLRTCGYGIPDMAKALYCGSNSLTLIAQEAIQPFDKKENGSGYRTKDMHFYELPWPNETLLELGSTPVKMRVTLSYFIEPGPGEIGWKDRYRYRSHGLKFDVNTIGETKDQFVKRVNKAAREDDEKSESTNDSGRWVIGSQTRNLGSVHSDIIEASAAEIATCNYIGVFPVIGWWRERSHLGKWNKKTRYSLIVSIETPAQGIDIYTPVAIKLQIPIEV